MNNKMEFLEACRSVRFCHDIPAVENTEVDIEQNQLQIARIKASALEISRFLLPDHHISILRVSERLHLDDPPRVYVVNDPVPNAQVLTDHEKNNALILCNSGLINLLEIFEFDFVLGHELGHFGLQHSPQDHSELNPVELVHELRKNRAAELSCDRVGLLAIQSLNTATSVMIKSASGLKGPFRPEVSKSIIETFNKTNSKDQAANIDTWDTHPAIASRVWSLYLFAGSQLYLDYARSGGTGKRLDEVDRVIIDSIFGHLDGTEIQAVSKNIDLAISWVGALIIVDDGNIDESEIEGLNSMMGEHLSAKIIKFCKYNSREAVMEKASEALIRIQDIPDLEKRNFEKGIQHLISTLNPEFDSKRLPPWKNILDIHLKTHHRFSGH